MDNISISLHPDDKPIERGYMWARYSICIPQIEEVDSLYYCAEGYTAAELMENQIRPTLYDGKGYFAVFPLSNNEEIKGTHTAITTTYTVVYFGSQEDSEAQEVARYNTTLLMEYFRGRKQRYISAIRMGSSRFDRWDDTNSIVTQFTTTITVVAHVPYGLTPKCL